MFLTDSKEVLPIYRGKKSEKKMRLLFPNSFAAQLTLGVLGISLVGLLVLTTYHLKYTYTSTSKIEILKLQNELDTQTSSFNSQIDGLRKDALFLASVPPIQGIIRATQEGNIDKFDQSTIAQWKERLQTIFKEMLISKPEYSHIQYIGIATGGKELVRVDKNQARISIQNEAMLQKKGDEQFFKEAIKIAPNKVYLSTFSHSREWGKLVQPPQLIIRGAVPIYYGSYQIFGIVVINMLADKVIGSLLKSHQKGKSVTILNSELDPLLLSSQAQGWLRVDDTRKADQNVIDLFETTDRSAPMFGSISGDYLVVGKKVFIDPLKPNDFLGVTISTPDSSVYKVVWDSIYSRAILMISLMLVSTILLLIFTKKQTQPLKELRSLAEELASGQPVVLRETLTSKGGEINDLTRAFFKMSEEIQRKTAALRSQKEALDEAALVSETDSRGRIIYANEKFSSIAGYSVEELIGSDHRIVNSGFHSKEFFQNLWKTIKSGQIWRGEVQNKKKDGTSYWVDSSIIPYKDPTGKIVRFVSIRFDITEKKRQEQKLKELTEAKSKFLAVMSHEIRTPLGAVIGLNDVLAATELNKNQNRIVKNIDESANVLLNIINDILDLSKLESGKMDVVKEPIIIRELAEGMLQMFSEKALDKKIIFQVETDSMVPECLELDSVRLKQIIMNLVSNAIKFTNSGSVKLKLSCEENSDKLWLLGKVQDTGIGMTESQLKIAFNEFEQADGSTTKKYGGTGLGLPICKRILEIMGGGIHVESVMGKGTTFSFKLPTMLSSKKSLQIPSQDEDFAIKELSLKNIKILMAEDYSLNQEIFKSMMKNMDFSVTVVNNGKEAVEKFEAEAFDLVFLDIQMPVMDGMDACKGIQSLMEKNKNSSTWVVALTANAFKEDVDRYFSIGFNDHVSKPFNRKTIREALLRFHQRKIVEKSENENAVNDNQLLNSSQIDDLMAIGIDDFKPIWRQFRDSSKLTLDQLAENIQSQKQELASNEAHTLKGSLLNMGMTACANCLVEIEAAIESENWSLSSKKISELKGILTASIKEFQNVMSQENKAA